MGIRATMKAAAGRAVEAGARRVGYDAVTRGFYSPIPDLSEVPASVFERRSPMAGITFDTDRQLEFARTHLAPHFPELADATDRWSPDVMSFGAVDAEVAFAMVRHLRPHRLVELGAGWSSHVLGAACLRNAAEGHPVRYRAFEPYPGDVVGDGVPGLDDLGALKAQDVPAEVFDELDDGDVLFVDTTHTVKVGSDVNRIVLDVLPVLRPGVAVHFHDIFLPGEYHRGWVEIGIYWAEQYLVQAFLSLNRDYEVLWSSAGVWLDHRAALHELVPSLRGHRPSSLWIRRTA